MKKIYYVTGLGGSGKSTFAKKMAQDLGIAYFRADDIYFLVKEKLGLTQEELRQMPMLQTWDKDVWGEYGTPEKLLEVCYNEFFSYNPPQKLVLEGEALFFNPREFAVASKIFEGYDVRHFVIQPDYEQWLKFRSKREQEVGGTLPIFREEEDFILQQKELLSYVPNKNRFIITDPTKYECSLTGGTEYQNEDFSNPKWAVFDLKNLKGKKYFEISCNTGWFTQKAREAGAKVWGLDISWQVLDKALDRVPDGTFYLSKIEDFDFKEVGKFDVILCSSAFHYYHHREEQIKKISEACKTFILELPTLEGGDNIRYQGGSDGEFCSVVSESLIEKWLSKYFEHVDLIGQTITPNGEPRPVYRCTHD